MLLTNPSFKIAPALRVPGGNQVDSLPPVSDNPWGRSIPIGNQYQNIKKKRAGLSARGAFNHVKLGIEAVPQVNVLGNLHNKFKACKMLLN